MLKVSVQSTWIGLLVMLCTAMWAAAPAAEEPHNAKAVSGNSTLDPVALLQSYEKTLAPYERFKVTWAVRNARLTPGGEPEWLNRSELILVRDQDRARCLSKWEDNNDAGQSHRNWQEEVVEKGKTRISVHPPHPASPNAPVVICNLHVSAEDILRHMRGGLPQSQGIIHDTWIPAFLRASNLSAKHDRLDGRTVDVLRGVSDGVEITLWLDPALGHVARKIAYDNRSREATLESPAVLQVYEVRRFEEREGVLVPVEAVETKQCPARPAIGMIYLKVVDGKEVVVMEPKKDEKGQIVMAPPNTNLTEVNVVDIQFPPKLADEDLRISTPIPEGTKVNVSGPSIRHVSYDWKQGKVVKIVEPAIQGKFDPAADVAVQIADRLRSAKWKNERVLVLFGANDWRRTAALEETFLSNPETLLRLIDEVGTYSYRLVLADVSNRKNRGLAAEYGLTLDDRQSPCMTVLGSNGRVLCNQDLAAFEQNGRYDAEKIVAFLVQWEPPGNNALDVLHVAFDQAAKQQKKPFVIVSGKSCVPCHRLVMFLAGWQDVLDEDYIFIEIDQERMTHVDEAKAHLGYPSGPGATIPWYAILSPSGEKLVTSMGPDGNIGLPSNAASIQYFVTMLRQTSSHISPEQYRTIEESLAALHANEPGGEGQSDRDRKVE